MALAGATIGGSFSGGGGNVNQVMGNSSSVINDMTPTEGKIDLRGIDIVTETSDGFFFPDGTAAECAALTAQSQACVATDTDELCIGDGAAGTVCFGAGGTGDITAVGTCSSGACAEFGLTDGNLLDLSAIDPNTTTEGITMPQAASLSGNTAEGQCGWDTDDDDFACGNATGVTVVGPVSLEEAATEGRNITSANSRANGVFIGDSNNDGMLHYTGTSGPTQECVIDLGGGGETTCDVTLNAAAGDSILLQQDGTTVVDVDNAGVNVELPTGDSLDVNLNSVDVLTIDEASGAAFVLPSGDTFDVTVNSVNTVSVDDTAVTVTGNVSADGEVTGLVRHSDDTTATVALAAPDCRGSYHKNNDADAIDYTLPDGETGGGQLCCFEDRAGGTITVDVNDGSETITLADGTALTAGDAVDLASGIGNAFCIFSDSATAWHIMPGAVGDVTDGGVD